MNATNLNNNSINNCAITFNNIVGSYKITAVTYQYNPQSAIQDTYSTWPVCKQDDIWNFNADSLITFTTTLAAELKNTSVGLMLHKGIETAYQQNATNALQQQDVKNLSEFTNQNDNLENKLSPIPILSSTSAKIFLQNPILHKEVFGPYAIIVGCINEEEVLQVAKNLEGQLTSTLMATLTDLQNNENLIDCIKN